MLNNETLARVSKCKYLGPIITENPNDNDDIYFEVFKLVLDILGAASVCLFLITNKPENELTKHG